jgi:hypothetical protein
VLTSILGATSFPNLEELEAAFVFHDPEVKLYSQSSRRPSDDGDFLSILRDSLHLQLSSPSSGQLTKLALSLRHPGASQDGLQNLLEVLVSVRHLDISHPFHDLCFVKTWNSRRILPSLSVLYLKALAFLWDQYDLVRREPHAIVLPLGWDQDGGEGATKKLSGKDKALQGKQDKVKHRYEKSIRQQQRDVFKTFVNERGFGVEVGDTFETSGWSARLVVANFAVVTTP